MKIFSTIPTKVLFFIVLLNIMKEMPLHAQSLLGGWGCKSEVYFSNGVGPNSTLALNNPNNIIFNYPFNLNAIGYNELDDFIYGIRRPINHLVRFHSNGSFDDLGDLGGAINISPVVGGFDNKGLFYIREGNSMNPTVIVIDVANLTAKIDNSGGFDAKDWAFHPSSGKFYGVANGELHAYTPGGGFSSTILSGLEPGEGPVYGSSFYANDGFIYVANNNSTKLYRIDVVNSIAHYVTTYNIDQGDGTSCPKSIPPYSIVYAKNDTICVSSTGVAIVDVLANDTSVNTTIVKSKFSIVEAPVNGKVTYNSTTGEITYIPFGSAKNDVFKYQICGNASPSACDFAYVHIKARPQVSFPSFGPYCQNTAATLLPEKSIEGFKGLWNPSSINTNVLGTSKYTFNTNAGLGCDIDVDLNVNILPEEIPTFTNLGPYCVGDIAAALSNTSIETIKGIWSPSSINTSIDGTTTYSFVPDANLHPCAKPYEMKVNVAQNQNANFNIVPTYCQSSSPSALPLFSLEGVAGTWFPDKINTDDLGNKTYTFTPDPILHPCSVAKSLSLEVVPPIDVKIISQACADDLKTYSIVFSIVGSTGVFPKINTDGFLYSKDINGNYSISGIPKGKSITIEVKDNISCSQSLINTPEKCECPLINSPSPINDFEYCSYDTIKSFSVASISNLKTIWYKGNQIVSNGNSFKPITDGLYTVGYQSTINGCESDKDTFYVKALPKVAFKDTVYNCSADLKMFNFDFNVSSGTAPYVILNNGNYNVKNLNANNFTIENIKSNSKIEITILDAKGCLLKFDASKNCTCPTINAPTALKNDTICNGAQNGLLKIVNIPQGYEVKWYNAKSGGNAIGQSSQLNNLKKGQYFVEFVQSISGCTSERVSASVIEATPFTVTTNTSVCRHEMQYDMKVFVSGGLPSYTLKDIKYSNQKLTNDTFLIKNIQINDTVKLTIVDRLGCELKTSLLPKYLLLTPAIIVFNKTYLCSSLDSIVLSSVNFPAGALWTGPSSFMSTANFVTVKNPGTYIFRLANQFECFDYDTINIEKHDLKYEIISNDISCGAVNDGLISVKNLNPTFPLNVTIEGNAIPQDSFKNLNAGTYKLFINDEYCFETNEIEVKGKIPFTVFAGIDTFIQIGNAYQVIASTNLSSDQIENIVWSPNETLDCGDCLTPLANPTNPTNYQLTITSIDGCSASSSFYLDIKSVQEIILPNIIKKGSGTNSVFSLPNYNSIKQVLDYNVYDRWGSLIYKASNFLLSENEKYWDGTMNGNEVVAGVYVYVIKLEAIDGKELKYIGNLTLVK